LQDDHPLLEEIVELRCGGLNTLLQSAEMVPRLNLHEYEDEARQPASSEEEQRKPLDLARCKHQQKPDEWQQRPERDFEEKRLDADSDGELFIDNLNISALREEGPGNLIKLVRHQASLLTHIMR
jgi:hypothetical protein